MNEECLYAMVTDALYRGIPLIHLACKHVLLWGRLLLKIGLEFCATVMYTQVTQPTQKQNWLVGLGDFS